jgi:hypothetical protein
MDGDAGTRAGAPRNLRRETDKAKTGFRGDPGRAADTVSVTASAIEVVPESSTWAMPPSVPAISASAGRDQDVGVRVPSRPSPLFFAKADRFAA